MTEIADRIYLNSEIITMDPFCPMADALATRNGHILKVGTGLNVRSLAGMETEVFDLGGRTLMPGFIDAHSHFVRAGLYDLFLVDLRSPPVGKIKSIPALISKLRQAALDLPKDAWILGYGYDDTLLEEKRQPTAKDLNRASMIHPICIRHVSGHLAVLNTPALKLAGISMNTVAPVGGRIGRDEGTGEPSGVLDGEPAMELARHALPSWDPDQWLKAVANASSMYAARGVTTAQEGDAQPEDYEALLNGYHRGLLSVRVQFYPNWQAISRLKDYPRAVCGAPLTPDRMLVTGGVKMYQDGSIQGYSGYLSEPYYHLLYPQTHDKSYRGRPRNLLSCLKTDIVRAHQEGWQIAVHANGDQAIEDVIECFESAIQQYPRKDPRHIIIHCQTVREDQLDRMRSLGILPSFFTTHTYFWGDRHRDIFLGPKRAMRLDPCGSAMARGMSFTCHNDTYVTPIDPLMSVWSAVNRISAGGSVLGEEFRVPVMEGLRSITTYAAYQNHEENFKGSLTPGKLADMVVLEDNPLKIDPSAIKDIRIGATIIGDKIIFGTL